MSSLITPVGPHDHVIGSPRAPVTLVEYGDYQCPFCGRAHRAVESQLRRFSGDVRYAFRHFPLTHLHPHARLAAIAAEAAGAQGKFWAMHRTLFENQEALGERALIAYADAIGLDVPRFSYHLELGTQGGKVNDDFESGVRSGVAGTPTFFINGARFEDRWDTDAFARAIRHAMTEAQPLHR